MSRERDAALRAARYVAAHGVAPESAWAAVLAGERAPEDAAEVLRAKGFKISKPKTGPATEYAKMDAWLDIRKVDRGKRMTAKGKYLGESVFVDLVFGFNNQLERVHVRTALWDQTQKGGARMTKAADKLTDHLEREFGTANEKSNPYGYTDTAAWGHANDGSAMEMYMRGTEGFMFYPPHKTVLTVSFSASRGSTWPSGIRLSMGTITQRSNQACDWSEDSGASLAEKIGTA